MLFNIGDLVTRKSHNNDTVFKIVSISNDIVILKGLNIRLMADAVVSDLVHCVDCENDLILDEDKLTDRIISFSEFFSFSKLLLICSKLISCA